MRRTAYPGAFYVPKTKRSRRAIDIGRARSRRAAPAESIADTGDPVDHHARADTRAELAVALAALPDRQRQCVAYHYLAGLPYAEVAAIVGGTADAARRAAADGIAALRRTAALPARSTHSTRRIR